MGCGLPVCERGRAAEIVKQTLAASKTRITQRVRFRAVRAFRGIARRQPRVYGDARRRKPAQQFTRCLDPIPRCEDSFDILREVAIMIPVVSADLSHSLRALNKYS